MKKVFETIWFQPYTPLIVLILICLGFARFVYPPIQKAIQGTKIEVPLPTGPISPTPVPVLGDTASLIERIRKHILLPTDEAPQVVPITNIEQFKGQPFFKNAKNGDVLLLYPTNKKAILYDPIADKVIDTAPIGDNTEQPQPTPAQEAGPARPTPTASTTTPTPTPTSQLSPTPTPTATP